MSKTNRGVRNNNNNDSIEEENSNEYQADIGGRNNENLDEVINDNDNDNEQEYPEEPEEEEEFEEEDYDVVDKINSFTGNNYKDVTSLQKMVLFLIEKVKYLEGLINNLNNSKGNNLFVPSGNGVFGGSSYNFYSNSNPYEETEEFDPNDYKIVSGIEMYNKEIELLGLSHEEKKQR